MLSQTVLTLTFHAVHHGVRLERCKARSTRNCSGWERIAFNYESRFQLCPDDNRRRVLRRPLKLGEPTLTISNHTGPQQGFMIWSVISFDSRTQPVFISCTVTAQLYDDDILQPVTLLFLLRHSGLTFQHNNVRLHTTCVTMNYLQDCPILPWPA